MCCSMGLSTNETWAGQMPDFGARFRVLAPERRGHARTTRSRCAPGGRPHPMRSTSSTGRSTRVSGSRSNSPVTTNDNGSVSTRRSFDCCSGVATASPKPMRRLNVGSCDVPRQNYGTAPSLATKSLSRVCLVGPRRFRVVSGPVRRAHLVRCRQPERRQGDPIVRATTPAGLLLGCNQYISCRVGEGRAVTRRRARRPGRGW